MPSLSRSISRLPTAAGCLRPCTKRWLALEPFEAAPLESAIRALADERQIKAAAVIHVARVAVTGRTVSPGLFETLELVGRERVLARLEAAARAAV